MIVDSQPDLGLDTASVATCNCAQLVVGAGSARLVAEFLEDGQGFARPVVCLIQPPPVVGGDAELVIAERQP